MGSRFREIDELVLQLKGLVLVRELLEARGAYADEIDAHSAEIGRVRDRLARAVQDSSGAYGWPPEVMRHAGGPRPTPAASPDEPAAARLRPRRG